MILAISYCKNAEFNLSWLIHRMWLKTGFTCLESPRRVNSPAVSLQRGTRSLIEPYCITCLLVLHLLSRVCTWRSPVTFREGSCFESFDRSQNFRVENIIYKNIQHFTCYALIYCQYDQKFENWTGQNFEPRSLHAHFCISLTYIVICQRIIWVKKSRFGLISL